MQLISAEEAIEQSLESGPLIDVRAAVEYSCGSFPGAVNLPILNDSEREQVGTSYKQNGQENAIALGHSLVQPHKDSRIAAWTRAIEEQGSPALYCARGGMRSEIAQQWLRDSGLSIPRVARGYKALRQALIAALDSALQRLEIVVISGPTGSGKTAFLQTLGNDQAILDLEGIACHRGSAFGSGLKPQPAQADFENRLAIELVRIQKLGVRELFVEDESKAIGKLVLPEGIFARIDAAKRCLLEVPLTQRVRNIQDEYIREALLELEQIMAVEDALQELEQRMLGALSRISRALGDQRYRECKTLMMQAFREHEFSNDQSQHALWIEYLLIHYYDPYYQRHLEKKRDLIYKTIRQNDYSSDSFCN